MLLGNEKQSQFKANCQDIISTIQEDFRGFGCWKGYTAVYMKSEFYEFWEVNHEKQ